MPSFNTMSKEDRDGLVAKLSEAIKKHGFQDKLKIDIIRQTVCPLQHNEVKDDKFLYLKGSFAPDKKDAVQAFKDEIKPLTEGVENIEVEVACLIGAGCQYDPIKNIVPINGGDPITLEHKAGEVWLIDFWATWCPPCQAPMQHNEDMLKKRAADWGDKVKIIGISIDNKAEVVVDHVKAKDWNSPIHYHRAGSDCSQQYAVRGVPNVMIIDTTGKIVYKGHPATRPDLEADFDTLLKGEALTGPGAESADAPQAAAGGDAAKEMDFDAHNAVVDKFASEIGPGLQANETIKASAGKMQRAFCVMVLKQEINAATGKMTGEFQNFRDLCGKQEDIDACKKVMEEMVQGEGYELIPREKAV